MARSGVERVGLELPQAPAAASLLSRVPYSAWFVLLLGLYAYWSYRSTQSQRSKQPRRRINNKPPNRRPTALDSPRRLASSPQLSRRSSFARGPRGPTTDSYASSQASRPGSPFRPSFSSGRIVSLAQGGGTGGTPASSIGGPSRHANSFGPDMSEASLPYSPSMPSIAQRLPMSARSSGMPRSASSYSIGSQSRDYSPAQPRRRFMESYAATVPDSASRKRRDFDTDSAAGSSARGGKRSRMNDNQYAEEDSDDAAMELDEMVQLAEEQQRGSKRGHRGQGGSAKRARRQESEVGDEEGGDGQVDEMDTEPDSEYSTKKRTRAPRESDESLVEESAEDKRARRDQIIKGSGKRGLDAVDTPTEEGDFDFDEADEAKSPRNADSEVDEEDEVEEEQRGRRRSHRSKRARSTEGRDGSDADSMMGDDDFEAEAAASAPLRSPEPASPRKRGGKAHGTVGKSSMGRPSLLEKSSSKTFRKPGDEWVNLEGDRCRMDGDGKQRKLCEVREMRRKYKMPKDSIHPDAKIMHEVVVEKWLTQEEYSQLLAQGKLAWQTTGEDEAIKSNGAKDAKNSTASQNGPPAPKQKGIYFATGTRTPLRTHSVLASRPSSGSASPASVSHSPTYATLLNGRLRLPSGAHASPARSWSTSKSARLGEDEQKARAERERRRRASIMLGGEEEVVEPPPKEPTPPPHPAPAPAPAPAAPFVAKVDNPKPAFRFGAAPAANSAGPSPTAPSASNANAASFFSQPPTPASASEAPKTSAPAKTATPDFFANLTKSASAAPATALSETKKDAPAATAPPFSLGALPKPNAPAPPAAADAPKPAFSFGAPPATPMPASTPSATPASGASVPAPFSFGNPPAPAASAPTSQAPKPAPAARFSFGAPPVAAPPAQPASTSFAPAPASTPSFSFGAAPRPAEAPTPASTPSFSFGASSTAAPPAPATGGFSFGAPVRAAAANNAPAPIAASKPAFSFGSAAAAPPVNNATTPSAAPAFSFGSNTSAPAAGSGGFSFGATSSNAPLPSVSSATPHAGQPFTFGQTPIVFGSGAQGATTPGQSPGIAPAAFNFGSGGEESGGTAAPRRRIAGRRPTAGR